MVPLLLLGISILLDPNKPFFIALSSRIRRLDENAQITMFEKGNYVSFANCGLPYYVGNVIQKVFRFFNTDLLISL